MSPMIGIVTIRGHRVAGARIGRIGIVHVFGSRQIDIHVGRLTVAVGLPLEWPVWRHYEDRVRVGFGPVAVSWWDKREVTP